MKDLLDLILSYITTHPDEAKVAEAVEGDVTVYTISVHPEDMGRVIGKDGKVIRAIRSLAHVVAIRQNQRYRIILADSGEPADASAQTDTPETATEAPVETTADTPAEDLIAGAIDLDESPKK